MVTITREIGIDMAHRVEAHGSKCKHLHGHRYTVHATVSGPIVKAGEEKGMVMDFGFLKEAMMDTIDAVCDHATTLSITDPIAIRSLGPQYRNAAEAVKRNGWTLRETDDFGKLVLIDRTPTAENLAEVWFYWVSKAVFTKTKNRVQLLEIKVWETPNCFVVYRHTHHTDGPITQD